MSPGEVRQRERLRMRVVHHSGSKVLDLEAGEPTLPVGQPFPCRIEHDEVGWIDAVSHDSTAKSRATQFGACQNPDTTVFDSRSSPDIHTPRLVEST